MPALVHDAREIHAQAGSFRDVDSPQRVRSEGRGVEASGLRVPLDPCLPGKWRVEAHVPDHSTGLNLSSADGTGGNRPALSQHKSR